MLNKNKFILFASTIGKQIEFTSFDSFVFDLYTPVYSLYT